MVYLLRHGLDDERLIGGWSDVPLVKEGVMQVQQTIKFMKDSNISFQKIYSSDIKRARQTAELVSESYHVPVEFHIALRELDKGDLTGLSREVALKKYPEYVTDVEVEKRYPNGESLQDLYLRQKEVLKWISQADDILIVTHRGPINMYYFLLEKLDLTNDKKQFGVTHASLHEFNSKTKSLRKLYDPKEK